MIALKLMVNKWLRYLKKVNMLDFKNYESKIKLPFIIYADIESILILFSIIHLDNLSHFNQM